MKKVYFLMVILFTIPVSFFVDKEVTFAQVCDPAYYSSYSPAQYESTPCWTGSPYFQTMENGSQAGQPACHFRPVGGVGLGSTVSQYVDVKKREILGPVSPNPSWCSQIYSPALCADVTPEPVYTTVEQACTPGAELCNNGIKNEFECCDEGVQNGQPGGACSSTCSCNTTVTTCGDGVCNGYETTSNCSIATGGDCSGGDTSVCPINPIEGRTIGPTDITIYKGGSGVVGYEASPTEGTGAAMIDVTSVGCPTGAVCTGDLDNFNIAESDDPNHGYIINTNSNTEVGDYTFLVNVQFSNDERCAYSFAYTIHIEPGLQSTCDGTSWYDIPGQFTTNVAPVAINSSGSIYTAAVSSLNGNLYELSCFGASSSNPCTWNTPPWSDLGKPTGTAISQSPGASIVSMARAFWVNVSGSYRWTPSSGWSSTGGGPSFGTPTTATDTYNRTYNFRRGSGGVAQYMCSEPAVCPAGNVSLLSSTIGIGGNTVASAPSGWSGGVFYSSASSTASIAGTQVNGVAAGSANIVGGGWTASNGATSCGLGVAPITVSNATASIDASPNPIPYNTASTLSWSYSNASSCTITAPGSIGGYPSGSGSASTGALTLDRTYTISCSPGPVTDSVVVNVNVPLDYALTVIKAGQGTVVSDVSGISCGVDCTEDYTEDSVVTLTATPNPNRIFTGWIVQGGGACPGTGTCSVTMSSPKSVTANFVVDPNYKEF